MDIRPADPSARLNEAQLTLQLISGVVILLLGVAGLLGTALWLSRSNHEQQAIRFTNSVASSLALAIETELRQVETAMLTVAATFKGEGGTGTVDDLRLAEVLRQQQALLPSATRIRLTDAEGVLRVGLNPGESRVNLGDREYFARAMASSGPVLSEPLQGRIYKDWGVVMALRLRGADGRFAGIASTFIPSQHLARRLSQVSVGRTGAVSLRMVRGALVAQFIPSSEHQPVAIGSTQISTELAQVLVEGRPASTYTAVSATDGVKRINAVNRLQQFPLAVVVGLGHDELLTPWWSEVSLLAAVGAGAVFMTVWVALALHRQHRLEVRLRTKADRLATWQNLMLDNELVAMVRLRDRVAVWNNRALERMFGYAPGELEGQPARRLYLDQESYDELGRAAYPMLNAGLTFRTQLKMRHKDGSALWVDLAGARLDGEESLWTLVDVSALKAQEAAAIRLALHDPLTELPNRRLFEERLQFLLTSARRTGAVVALGLIDLDGFKPINDEHGHPAGDAVLIEVARRLQACVRSKDVVARLGGDEFGVVLSDVEALDSVRQVLERAMTSLNCPITLPTGTSVRVGASVGVAITAGGLSAADRLVEIADGLLYQQKRTGQGGIGMLSADPPQGA